LKPQYDDCVMRRGGNVDYVATYVFSRLHGYQSRGSSITAESFTS
jgi:hypothetical protein